MDRFIHNNDFNKDVIYEKMSKIASELEKMEKNLECINIDQCVLVQRKN